MNGDCITAFLPAVVVFHFRSSWRPLDSRASRDGKEQNTEFVHHSAHMQSRSTSLLTRSSLDQLDSSASNETLLELDAGSSFSSGTTCAGGGCTPRAPRTPSSSWPGRRRRGRTSGCTTCSTCCGKAACRLERSRGPIGCGRRGWCRRCVIVFRVVRGASREGPVDGRACDG